MAKNEKSAAAEKIEAAEKVKAKKPKSDKPNIFVRMWQAIVRFFKDLRGETKKIIWPDGKTVLKSTGVVLAVIAVFTVVIWLIDLGLSKSIDLLSNVARDANTSVSEVADAPVPGVTNTVSEDIQIEPAEDATEKEAAVEEADPAIEVMTEAEAAVTEAAAE